MSIESMTLGLRSEIEADAGLIRTGTFELDSLRTTMLGDSGEVASQFEATSGEFTDLIAWDIRGVGQDELESWQRTARNLLEGSTALNLWADAIDEYKRERSRIEEDWEEEKAAAISRVESATVDANESTPMALSGFIGVAIAASAIKGKEAREAEQIEYLNEIKAELRAEHDTAWENLMDAADDCKRNLRDGMDQEALEEAIDRGLLTWTQLGWYGSDAPLPVDSRDGSSTAENIAEYVEDPEGYEGDVEEVIAMIAAVNAASLRNQRNGTELHPNEMEFLESLYDSLEENRADERIPGVLGLSDDIVNSDEIDPDLQELMLGALGDGILTVSNENLGGGFDKLPDSVRNTSLGPDPMEEFTNEQEHFGRADWALNAAFLSDLFEHTNPELKGGSEFSTNLTATVGFELAGGESAVNHSDEPADEESEEEGGLEYPPINPEEWAENLISVSSRNTESNYEILTGEVSEDHPIHRYELPTDTANTDPDITGAILRGLYGFDWHADEEYGSSDEDLSDREVRNEADDSPARALTDWISEWESSEDGEQNRMAAEAAHGLITSLSGAAEEDLRSTGIGVDESVDASFTEVNPGIAESLSQIYISYIESFGLPEDESGDILSVNEDNQEAYPGMDSGDIGIHLTKEAREDFLQFLLANEDAAPNLMASTLEYESNLLDQSLFGEDIPAAFHGAHSGRLIDMMESALLEEHESRIEAAETSDKNAQDEVTRRWETAYKVLAATATGGASVVNAPLGMTIGAMGITAEEPLKDILSEYAGSITEPTERPLPPQIRMERDGDIADFVRIQTANSLVDSGIVDIQQFIDAGVAIELEDGSHRLPMHSGEWGSERDLRSPVLQEVLEEIPMLNIDGTSGSASDFVDQYFDGYSSQHAEK